MDNRIKFGVTGGSIKIHHNSIPYPYSVYPQN